MRDKKITEGEYRLASIVWDNEPISSMELVKLCEKMYGWKKSTTYTVLKKLCELGILKNENTIVSSIIKQELLQKTESERFINRIFNGSLPKFLTTFVSGKKLSKQEAEELIQLINIHKEE